MSDNSSLSIIILAGGLGTRIQSSIGNTPKIMALINGTPFINYLITWIQNSFENTKIEIILATSHLHSDVKEYCTKTKLNVKFSYENKPTGTLAAAYAASKQSKYDYNLILNGDTLFELDLSLPFQYHREEECPVLVCKVFDENVSKQSTYGLYEEVNENLTNITPPIRKTQQPLVSLGALFITKDILISNVESIKSSGRKLMIDCDLIHNLCDCKPYLLPVDSKFIDIGTSKSYSISHAFIPLLKLQ